MQVINYLCREVLQLKIKETRRRESFNLQRNIKERSLANGNMHWNELKQHGIGIGIGIEMARASFVVSFIPFHLPFSRLSPHTATDTDTRSPDFNKG
jgi:hypothetical protein